MKTKLIIIALICFFNGFMANSYVQAQTYQRKINIERFDSIRSKHMADVLMLSDATTAKFIPLYHNYLSEVRSINTYNKIIGKKNHLKTQKTDAEIQKMIEESFERSQKILDIRIKYYKEFKKFLSPKQTARLFMPNRRPKMRSFMKRRNIGAHAMNQPFKNMAKNKWMKEKHQQHCIQLDTIQNNK